MHLRITSPIEAGGIGFGDVWLSVTSPEFEDAPGDVHLRITSPEFEDAPGDVHLRITPPEFEDAPGDGSAAELSV